MLFERFYTLGLAQVAYLVADEAAGVAAIIDPRRDVEAYVDWAAAHRVRITAILETHVHADFVSGARELAVATGAAIFASKSGDQSYPTHFLDDGDAVSVGALRLRALATPGHTPEHLAFLLIDPATGPEPIALFSGDALFVGEVGRPDLLGAAQTDALVRQLYHTVQRLKALDDAVIVYPGHTAGSSCGRKIGDAPSTTIGQEKRGNYAFRARSEAEFVAQVLAGMPVPPTYYPTLKQVNKIGPPLLNDLPPGKALTAAAMREAMARGALVIDARSPVAFAAGHIPGTYFAGLGPDFAAWTGWLAPYDRDLILVLDTDAQYAAARTELRRIGLDRVAGYLAGGMAAWDGAVTTLPQLTAIDVAAHQREGVGIAVLDVRTDEEWRQGHIPGALHRFAGELVQGAAAPIAPEVPVAVICGSGYRSTVAASILEARSYTQLINVTGGMQAWESAGLPEARADRIRKDAACHAAEHSRPRGHRGRVAAVAGGHPPRLGVGT
jgi:hydroxyacylglutathione hydrolase